MVIEEKRLGGGGGGVCCGVVKKAALTSYDEWPDGARRGKKGPVLSSLGR